MTQTKLTIALLSLALVGGCLYACAKPTPNNTNQTSPNLGDHAPLTSLQALELSQIGLAKDIAVGGDKLLIVNDKNELWQWGEPSALAHHVSDTIAPAAGFGKLAFADMDGHFNLIQNGKTYPSNIRLSPHSGMLVLPLAVIAVADDNGTPSLVRLEVLGDGVQVVAKFAPVLPDARPIQINFAGNNANGHIAVLSHPDSTTYQHGVLGDDIEARQLQFLERHSLTPLAKPLTIDGQVFEANTLAILPHDKGNRLVTTMAGSGKGARTVVIDNTNNTLKILTQSTPLPNNRWQSPFVFDGKLYAVQMPHLVGKLVHYQENENTLIEKVLGEGYSNHAIGDFETNLTVSTDKFAIIPKAGYRAVELLDSTGNLTTLGNLPARLIKAVQADKTAYLLLDNGQVWAVR